MNITNRAFIVRLLVTLGLFMSCTSAAHSQGASLVAYSCSPTDCRDAVVVFSGSDYANIGITGECSNGVFVIASAYIEALECTIVATLYTEGDPTTFTVPDPYNPGANIEIGGVQATSEGASADGETGGYDAMDCFGNEYFSDSAPVPC
jgi:hypothetical protein